MHKSAIPSRASPDRRSVLLSLGGALALPFVASGAGQAFAAPLGELELYGPPAGPSVILAHAAASGALSGIADRASFRAWRNPDEMRAGLTSGTMQAVVLPVQVAASLYNRGFGLKLLNVMTKGLLYVISADTGVTSLADLKGKRVSWVIGSPALQKNTAALLAFGGLDWGDVEKVEFGGYGAGLKGIINDQADAAFANSLAGLTYELAQSPRGLVYPPMPAADTEGWQRILALAPFFVPVKATDGANLSKDDPIELSMIPYPILTTLADRKAADVYAVMQAMDEAYPLYKDSAPGNDGWALDRQNLEWVVPYHEGAIQYFKEKGLWTDVHQKHNDGLIRRQQVLAEAWGKVLARNLEGEEHIAAWQEARASALREAGMEVGIEDW